LLQAGKDQWFAVIACRRKDKQYAEKMIDKTAEVDVGVERFAALSSGDVVSPKDCIRIEEGCASRKKSWMEERRESTFERLKCANALNRLRNQPLGRDLWSPKTKNQKSSLWKCAFQASLRACPQVVHGNRFQSKY
jgi:hypothetical protein